MRLTVGQFARGVRRLPPLRRLRARRRLRATNIRRVARAVARQPPLSRGDRRPAGTESSCGAPRTLLFVTVKRDNTSWRNWYGHWWVELDDDRSYGWWPAAVPLTARDLLYGAPGVLNAVGLVGLDGSWQRDPHHGQEAMHSFHPVLDEAICDEEVRTRIEAFAHSYQAPWRWHWSAGRSSGTCRGFQDELFAAVGLRAPREQLHTRGRGCPFLYRPRLVWWRLLDLPGALAAATPDASRGGLRLPEGG